MYDFNPMYIRKALISILSKTCKPIVLFVGHRQNVQTQLRHYRTPRGVLSGYPLFAYKRFYKNLYNNETKITHQPLKQIWTGLIHKKGKFHLASTDCTHTFKKYHKNTVIDYWVIIHHRLLYSYFTTVFSIANTITPRCRGRPDALLHQVVHGTKGLLFDYITNMNEITVLLPNPFDEILSSVSWMELLFCCKTENFTKSAQFWSQNVPLVVTKKASTHFMFLTINNGVIGV